MKLKKERKKIVEYGKKLIENGLTKGTGGNLSIYNPEEGLMVWMSNNILHFSLIKILHLRFSKNGFSVSQSVAITI